MKRKSILMTIVAVLFAGAVTGQIAWPTEADKAPNNVQGADTIFFCVRTDSLYPIELGYDVAGKRLHPSYGDWSLISKTSNDVTAADYNLDGTKNGGAGNAYKAVGSGIGGLLFQYKATDGQCGLKKDETYWIYVFVMPDENDLIQKDTLVCYDESGGTVNISLPNTYQKYSDLYAKAGVSYSWLNNSVYPIQVKKDSIASYTFMDTLKITAAPAGYTCGDTIIFKYKVRVDSTFTLSPLSLTICPSDTTGDMGKRDPNLLFDRNFNGSYSPSTIGNTGWSPMTKNVIDGFGNPVALTVFWKEFVYSGKDCKDKSYSVNDTLWITDNIGFWGWDTVTYCRDTAMVALAALWEDVDYSPNIDMKPILFPTASHWYDNGLGVKPYDAGTTDGTPSLAAGDYQINSDIMKSNVGYHYLWRVDPGASSVECLVDDDGIPDSGYMVVIVTDPAIAQDYTAQLCKPSYASAKFDLNLYTGLNVIWKQPSSGGSAAGLENNHDVDIDKVYAGTYKYAYELPALCGPGGKGVFYLKVTDKIKTPSSKTVLYCVDKLPASINVNDVLGVAVAGLEWSGPAVGFNTTTGILDVAAFTNANGAGAQDIVFTVSSGDSCGVPATTTVTVKFVTGL
jgi:hypothetical protein